MEFDKMPLTLFGPVLRSTYIMNMLWKNIKFYDIFDQKCLFNQVGKCCIIAYGNTFLLNILSSVYYCVYTYTNHESDFIMQ